MIYFPNVDPVILTIYPPFAISWYSLCYVSGLLLGLWYMKRLSIRFSLHIDNKTMDNLMNWIIVGDIIGARAAHVIFYDFAYYIDNPIDILKIYQGGLSFHGGVIGIALSVHMFAKKYKLSFYLLTDLICMSAPFGIFLVRIANFINCELYGRETNVPWGVIFPGHLVPRHPSQLYESFFEGLVLFIILYFSNNRFRLIKTHGIITFAFIALYGIFRSILEIFREPDANIGFIVGKITMGQILSLPMIFLGVIMMVSLYSKKHVKVR